MNPTFTQKIIALRGAAGQQWLDELPATIAHFEQAWDISCAEPFDLSYNYVAPARTRTSQSVVLKISFPDNTEFASEIAALRFYDGRAAIKVLKVDTKHGAALLERAVPGTRIGDLTPDEAQISQVVQVLQTLHRPVTAADQAQFLTPTDWAQAFDRYRQNYKLQTGPIPTQLFEEAQDIFAQYPQEAETQVLLHGDFHNDNILTSDRGWLAIDPKGIVGDPIFDVGVYLRNPYTDLPAGSDHIKMLSGRIDQFAAELGVSKKHIRGWTLANAVISMLWFLEDEGEFKEVYLRNAELASSLMK